MVLFGIYLTAIFLSPETVPGAARRVSEEADDRPARKKQQAWEWVD